MADAATPKTFRDLPRGRRIAAYVSLNGFLVLSAVLALAVLFGWTGGFLSYLILAFLMFLLLMHALFAIDIALTQRKVRKIDYWYLGAAAIGLLLLAIGYSQQRDLIITKFYETAHRAGEEPLRESVRSRLSDLSSSLCALTSPPFQAACEGTKRIAEEIKPNLTADQIKALNERYTDLVIIPYGSAFDPKQRKPEDFSPVTFLQLRLTSGSASCGSHPNRAPRLDEMIRLKCFLD